MPVSPASAPPAAAALDGARPSIPLAPAGISAALRLPPLAPLSALLTLIARDAARRRPAMLRRLGAHAHARFALDPTDLPVTLLLEPQGGAPRVTACRGAVKADARIAGPLAALVGLVHGAWDGDALFFSRDLIVEGDAAAALALRNAVDDAELDLTEEFADRIWPLGSLLRSLGATVEARTGLVLSRPEGGF